MTTDKDLVGACSPWWYLIPTSSSILYGLTLVSIVENTMALCFVAASVAATRQVQDMMELVTSLPKGDAESTSVAMGALVSLERVMRSVKADWGIAVTLAFGKNFVKALYYTLTMTLGIDTGILVNILIANGVVAVLCAHAVLLPAATATAKATKLMGAINRLRYTEDEAGNVRIASPELLQQSEALSQFVREGHNGGGLGIYLPLFGKLETEKVARVGSVLSGMFFFITKIEAASGSTLDNEIYDLRRGQLGLIAQMAAQEASFSSQLSSLQSQLGSLQAVCGSGSG